MRKVASDTAVYQCFDAGTRIVATHRQRGTIVAAAAQREDDSAEQAENDKSSL
jgi:hypothetical protein